MLANIGLPGLILIFVVILVLFGRGKVGALMADVGKGISSFRREIAGSGPLALPQSDVTEARDKQRI
jgi:sec-independent protein translocase protein TatA